MSEVKLSDAVISRALAIASCGTPVGAGDGNTYVMHPPTLGSMRRAIEFILGAPLAESLSVAEAVERERGSAKIYLASRYSRFKEMQDYRAELETMGHTVTSRWINGGHELTKEGSTEAHEAERIRYAQEDRADLLAADWVISFSEIPRETKTRGGRHVKHGMALALGKRVIVVGHRENVFHCLPEVEFFPTWELCSAAIRNRKE